MFCKSFITKKHTFRKKTRKQLTDLPVEIWLQILKLISYNELKTLWSPEIILNSKLAYAIGHLLIDSPIHIYKVAYSCWPYFEPASSKVALTAKEFFNILSIGKRNSFGFVPKCLTVLFFILTKKCYHKLKKLTNFLYNCLGPSLLNSEIVLVIGRGGFKVSSTHFSVINGFQKIHHLYMHKARSNFNALSGTNLTELVLKISNKEVITQYPQNLKCLRLSPKSSQSRNISVSLKKLPISLVYLKIDKDINLLDDGKTLPNLEYFECMLGKSMNHKVFAFLSKNTSLKYLHLEHALLTDFNFTNFTKLRNLSLTKCLNIPYQSLSSIRTLERLSLNGCDLSLIDNMSFPPILEEIYISPGNKDILSGLILPNTLRAITIIDIENFGI